MNVLYGCYFFSEMKCIYSYPRLENIYPMNSLCTFPLKFNCQFHILKRAHGIEIRCASAHTQSNMSSLQLECLSSQHSLCMSLIGQLIRGKVDSHNALVFFSFTLSIRLMTFTILGIDPIFTWKIYVEKMIIFAFDISHLMVFLHSKVNFFEISNFVKVNVF